MLSASVARWLSAGLTVGLLGLVMAAPAAASNSWGNYHWARTSNPFTLQLVDSVTTAWDGYLGGASADWSFSDVLDTAIVAGSTSNDTRKRCPAPTGQVRVCNATYGANGWLGLATIWIDSAGHIVQGTAKMNDTYFNTSTYSNANAKQHVMCQEVGHTLGLGHQSLVGSNSCMDDVNGLFDASYAHPNAHDYQQLVAIYGSHVDATSTLRLASSLAGRAGARDREDDGRLGRPAGTGRSPEVLFVKDAGDGATAFTWVFWAGRR